MTAELDQIAEAQSRETAAGVELARAAGLEVAGFSECAAGPPWATVLEAAGSRACSCIVVGSRGLTGSRPRSEASRAVLHHSRHAVLVVPPCGEAPAPD